MVSPRKQAASCSLLASCNAVYTCLEWHLFLRNLLASPSALGPVPILAASSLLSLQSERLPALQVVAMQYGSVPVAAV